MKRCFTSSLLALIFIGLISLMAQAPAIASSVPSCTSIKTVAVTAKNVITLPCLDGKSSVTYQAIRGPVIINVWASWCEPCKQELPYFVKLAATKKVPIVGIDVEERNTSVAKAFLPKHNMSWPILYDAKGITRGLFGMGVPVTWYVDASGKAIYKHIGVLHSYAELQSEVKKYLKITL